MVDKLEPRAILAKAYRDNGDIGAANYIEAGHDLLPDTQIHLLAIRDALEARTPANGEQVEREQFAENAKIPTPTEDARSRVMFLERQLAACKCGARHD